MDRRKIAFCDFGLNAATSRNLRPQLEAAFPENPVEVIGLGELVCLRNWRNIADVLLHYGWEIASGRKRFNDCLLRTRYSFESIRRALRVRLTADSYRFTFQTSHESTEACQESRTLFIPTTRTWLIDSTRILHRTGNFRRSGSSWNARFTIARRASLRSARILGDRSSKITAWSPRKSGAPTPGAICPAGRVHPSESPAERRSFSWGWNGNGKAVRSWSRRSGECCGSIRTRSWSSSDARPRFRYRTVKLLGCCRSRKWQHISKGRMFSACPHAANLLGSSS